MKSPILCRIGLHKLNKYTYVQVTRRARITEVARRRRFGKG